jgi:WD40 repeat protein
MRSTIAIVGLLAVAPIAFPALAGMSGHGGFVNAVAFSPDGRWAAPASWDNPGGVWDLATGREVSP